MGRVFLTIIVPLLLPTALYAVWRALSGKRINIPSMWIWLSAAGLALASLMLVLLSVDFGAPKQGHYVPPEVSPNGTVVPGHFDSDQTAPPRPR